MKNIIVIMALFCLAIHPLARAEETDILKKLLSEEIRLANSTASANFVAACINVTRDVQEKRLRIFATSSSAKTGTFKEGDFTIQVIYNDELGELDAKVAGAYYHHNNRLILSYAAWRFASGDKDSALRIVRIIAAANPRMSWSSAQQAPTSIQNILNGLEKNDGSVRQFLELEKNDWSSYVKLCGP